MEVGDIIRLDGAVSAVVKKFTLIPVYTLCFYNMTDMFSVFPHI